MIRFVVAGAFALGLSSPAMSQDSRPARTPASQPSKAVTHISGELLDEIAALKSRPADDAMGSGRRRAARDTLEAQRQLWLHRRPQTYLLRTYEISDCIQLRTGRARNGLLRDQLRVRDSTIVGRLPTPVPTEYGQRCERSFRVEDLFAEVRQALSDSTTVVRVLQYDPTYGFPRYYSLRHAQERSFGVLVESFAPAP